MVGFALLVILFCHVVHPFNQVWQCNFDDEGKRTVPTLIATLSEHEGEVTALSLHAEKNIAVSSGNVGADVLKCFEQRPGHLTFRFGSLTYLSPSFAGRHRLRLGPEYLHTPETIGAPSGSDLVRCDKPRRPAPHHM
jgi:hypothetical protein